MTRAELVSQIREKESFLCVGLDPDLAKLPKGISRDAKGVVKFLGEIIAATEDLCVAYKPNLAFFEALGVAGWEAFQQVVELIPASHMTIADAKRGDIGNTARMYAKAFFDQMGCEALTIAPYMGEDSVSPFLEFEGKWAVLLGLTSNPGSQDFQHKPLESGKPLYEEVVRKAMTWGSPENLMFVVGATQGDYLSHLRAISPEHFFLVPGVGAQGGDLATVARLAMNDDCGLLINSSRGIIYASKEEDFARAARVEAKKLQQHMAQLLAK